MPLDENPGKSGVLLLVKDTAAQLPELFADGFLQFLPHQAQIFWLFPPKLPIGTLARFWPEHKRGGHQLGEQVFADKLGPPRRPPAGLR